MRLSRSVRVAANVCAPMLVGAEGADLGNLRRRYAHCRRGSTPAATALTLGGEHRFRVSAGNFSHRNPAEAANERAQQKGNRRRRDKPEKS